MIQSICNLFKARGSLADDTEVYMIFLETNCYSHSLMRRVEFNVLLPECKKSSDAVGISEEKYKTIWLLHGLSGDQNSWIRRTSIERYAEKYGFAVVMPNVDRSWYTDTAYGAKYFTFITKELPEICRGCFKGMSADREDNIIAGLSMGGYGALKSALLCPDNYGFCISLSGSLDITRKGRPCNLKEWKSIFDFNMEAPSELEGSEHDLFAVSRKNRELGLTFPKIYMWCGTEDNLNKVNHDFDEELTRLGVEHTFKESEGDHSWKWWDMHIESALAHLFS